MSHATHQHLSELHVMTVSINTTAAALVRDFARAPEGAPLEELADLDGAIDAVGRAVTSLEQTLAGRERRAEANARAAAVAVAECRLRLEMLYAARPTPELEAVMAAMSAIDLEEK